MLRPTLFKSEMVVLNSIGIQLSEMLSSFLAHVGVQGYRGKQAHSLTVSRDSTRLKEDLDLRM